MTATPSSQARNPGDFLSPFFDVVIPFPQTRRVHAVARIAKRMARARTREKGEAVLAAAIRQQRGAMTRKGVASDKVERECARLESAVRARLWSIVFSPNSDDAA
ncbi:MAG: DUF6074 family protein [Xanthobacteraceae bacterium]